MFKPIFRSWALPCVLLVFGRCDVALTESGSTTQSNCDITVAKNGSADYRTVRAGINAAVDGSILCITPGTYNMNGFTKTINITLTIVGQNPRSTVLFAGGPLKFKKGFTIKNLSFMHYGEPIFILNPNAGQPQEHIVIENNIFKNSGSVLVDNSKMYSQIRDIRILGNQFLNLRSHSGLRVIGLSGQGAITNVLIKNNRFSNLRTTNVGKYAMAIMVGTNETRRLNNDIEISCNTIDGLVGGVKKKEESNNSYPETHGVLAYGKNVVISTNIIRDVNQRRDHEAIYLKGNHSRIINNIVENGGSDGGGGDITIKGGAYDNNVVSGNQISGMQDGTAIFVTGEITLENNYVNKPRSRSGVVVYGYNQRVNIRDNAVFSEGHSIIVHDASGGEVAHNVTNEYIDTNNSSVRKGGNRTVQPGDLSCQNFGYLCTHVCLPGRQQEYDATCSTYQACCELTDDIPCVSS